jgi:hypothetical protein
MVQHSVLYCNGWVGSLPEYIVDCSLFLLSVWQRQPVKARLYYLNTNLRALRLRHRCLPVRTGPSPSTH